TSDDRVVDICEERAEQSDTHDVRAVAEHAVDDRAIPYERGPPPEPDPDRGPSRELAGQLPRDEAPHAPTCKCTTDRDDCLQRGARDVDRYELSELQSLLEHRDVHAADAVENECQRQDRKDGAQSRLVERGC